MSISAHSDWWRDLETQFLKWRMAGGVKEERGWVEGLTHADVHSEAQTPPNTSEPVLNVTERKTARILLTWPSCDEKINTPLCSLNINDYKKITYIMCHVHIMSSVGKCNNYVLNTLKCCRYAVRKTWTYFSGFRREFIFFFFTGCAAKATPQTPNIYI